MFELSHVVNTLDFSKVIYRRQHPVQIARQVMYINTIKKRLQKSVNLIQKQRPAQDSISSKLKRPNICMSDAFKLILKLNAEYAGQIYIRHKNATLCGFSSET